MAKSKQIKRTLVSTFITFILCIAMLIGSTYAWFADNATVTASKIEAAVIDCVLQTKTDENDSWTDAAGHKLTFDSTSLNTSNKTATLEMRVVNKSGLNVKYTLKFTKASNNSTLANALDVYVEKNYGIDTVAPTPTPEPVATLSTDNTPPGDKIGTLAQVLDSKNSVITSNTLKAAATNTGDNTQIDCAYDEITLTLKLTSDADVNQGQGLGGLAVTLLASQCDESALNNPTAQTITLEKQDGTYVQIVNANEDTSPLSLLDGDTASEADESEDVRPFDLDGVCSFRSLDELDVENPYADYHADIVVAADRDVEAESLLVATYSELFCDGDWLGWMNDEKLTAGQETRLLRAMLDEEYSVSYGELFENGEKFKCAVADLGDNAGITVRVELRLYEVEDGSETGEYLVIGDYEHTF